MTNNKFLLLILTVFGIVIVYMAYACKSPYRFLYGRWQVYRYVPVEGVGCLSQEENDKFTKYLMDKKVVFSKTHLSFDNQQFNDPTYQSRKEKIDDYLRYGYRIPDRQVLGINQDTVEIINIHLGNKKMAEIAVEFNWSHCLVLCIDELIYCNGELLLHLDRGFYYLKKLK